MEISIENKKGNRIEFTHTYPYCLMNFNPSPVSYDINSYNNVGFQGEGYVGSSINRRNFKLGFSLCADSEDDLLKLKTNIQHTINPVLGKFILEKTIGETVYYIELVPLSTTQWKDITPCAVEGDITLVALDPYWKLKGGEKRVPITITEGSFEFTTDGPGIVDGGVELGVRGQRSYEIIVLNSDREVGMNIEVIFLGDVVNPKFINYSTNKFLQLDRKCVAGERLDICTEFEKKSCILTKIDGSKEYLNFTADSNLDFYLYPGDNIIMFDATSGKDSFDMYVTYSECYLEV